MTQKEAIIQYIKDFGSISSMEAYSDLGITQLGARIYELKEQGYVFKKSDVKVKNRYGKPIHFSRYAIEEI